MYTGCFEKEVSYINGETNEIIPIGQIEALIQLSDSCHQSFHYECTLAPLRYHLIKISNTDTISGMKR